jgi:3-oxoacyl-ACP reductase-like protein
LRLLSHGASRSSIAAAAAAAAAGAATIAVQEMAEDYAKTVQQLSLQLHLLRQPLNSTLTSQQQPLQKMKQLLHK